MRGCLLGLAMACAACSTSGFEPEPPPPSAPDQTRAGNGAPLDPADDRDGDGVCDGTEDELRSDPRRADTDGDGLPDFTEIIASFDPTDPDVPAPDQVAALSGAPQAGLEFSVRVTLDGSGQGYTGEFRAFDALDARGLSAKDFLEAATAVGGEPPDNVRGLQSESERFTSVMGKTRLAFQLRFRTAERGPSCAIGYPFEYRVKADNGRLAAGRDYVLVVAPEENDGAAAPFCVPEACL